MWLDKEAYPGGERARMSEEIVNQLAKDIGGKIEEIQRLPDGSGFAVMSMPLPKDHWLTQPGFNYPPAPFLMGTSNPERDQWAQKIRIAAKYAIRASTMNGKEDDFDPDAMVENFVCGMLGYWTHDGKSHV